VASIQRRAQRLESAISICLLAILSLITIGIFIKQSSYDISLFGIKATTSAISLQMLEADEEEKITLSALVPAGFNTLSKTEVYNPENLYEKINGKAPFYVESGFEELSTQRFVSSSAEALWMELFVYDMGNVRNAFSVYSTQKRAEAQPFPPMRFAYKTGNALYFVHGKYYVELVGSLESNELLKAMAEVARKIRANLPIDYDTNIDELALFPPENLIGENIKLYLTNAFGFEKLTNTFSAQYKLDSETITAFLNKRTDTQDAQLIAKSYYNFLIDNGGAAKPAVNKTFEGKVVDFYDTTEIVFATGPFVAGIHEAENQQVAEKLAEMLFNKLSDTSAE
jgi:hypothetical protein